MLLQRPSTLSLPPPAPGFLTADPSRLAGVIRILLILAGIEPNPGPKQQWYCTVCKEEITGRTGSVRCNSCGGWVHYRRSANCSGLAKQRDWTDQFSCTGCRPPTVVPPRLMDINVRPTIAQTANSPNQMIRILQLNCNGISGKIDEIASWMHANDILVAAFQETKLTHKSKEPSIPNHTIVRQDRERDGGGGLAFMIHHSLQFTALQSPIKDAHLESQAIKIGDIKLYNVYIPPASSCAQGYTPSITPLLTDNDAIVLGDFNAHDELWSSSLRNARGAAFAAEIGNSNFGVLNEDLPTRLPSNGPASSPDITLASMPLLASAEWRTHTALGSDHLPIVVTLLTSTQPQSSERRTYVNFAKADWCGFKEEIEAALEGQVVSDVISAEKKWRKITTNAHKHNVPSGRIKEIIPSFPTEAAEKVRERDALRATDPKSPLLAEMNTEIDRLCRSHRCEKWREEASSFDGRTNLTKLYNTIKRINGKPTSNPNQAISFKGKPISDPNKIAAAFNKQYSSVVPHRSNKRARKIRRQLKRLSRLDAPVFTVEQTRDAIKAAKASKAIGPDGLSTLHLKHLGPNGIRFLTEMFNLSLRCTKIPDIWRSSIIVPLLKPGKDPAESKSFRPVSLLCPAIKILERLLLPMLNSHLSIPNFQHGFRGSHSTVSALHDLNSDIASGFNSRKPAGRTVLLQIDLSKAFDMVNHVKLITDLLDTTLPTAAIRWFGAYLHGRQSRVVFRNKTSSALNVRTGVPQGAVTSPILFNFYLRKLPIPDPPVKVVQYADDISLYGTDSSIQASADAINEYAPVLLEFLRERDLIVSPEKSTVTLFTPQSAQAVIRPDIKLDGVDVPLERTPKILGVIHDTMYTFSTHVKSTAEQAKKRINVLKALAGTSWGQQKETIIPAYKSICRSKLEYAAPIWHPIASTSQTNSRKLQAVQNAGLRVATGCHRMTSIDHLHQETKILPLQAHSDLLTKQYALRCHLPGHPGQKHLDRPPPARFMKNDLTQELNKLGDLTTNAEGAFGIQDYKTGIRALHTDAVSRAVASYADNKVLNAPAPMINPSETELPRKARCFLAQLRSSYCIQLNSYRHRLSADVPDVCDKCGSSPHDVNHLFQCKENPTDLTPLDLWRRPKDVTDFLSPQ